MRLILLDCPGEGRTNFYPLSLSRPLWELRCGFDSLGEKLIAAAGTTDVAGFMPDYLAGVWRAKSDFSINDPSKLAGADLLLVDARVKADGLAAVATGGGGEIGLDAEGKVMYACIPAGDAAGLPTGTVEQFLDAAKASLPNVSSSVETWNYTWDLVLSNGEQIAADFAAAGQSGVEGTIEEPAARRGSEKDVYVARGALIHPMVVIDAAEGPVYIDEDVEIHPFTRVEGPCYVGKGSILLGAKCREGNSIGPMCRIGGEIEESIVHGYSNTYHDGFLGHAYVGEWVNLGALTTNSDLKNDYSTVSVMLGPRRPVDTGSTKVGSLIGDHAKTSIGTLLNTGSYVGAMTIVMATGKPLRKFIPSFAWFIEGVVTKGFGKRKLYETAEKAMGRRKQQWSEAEQAMWDAVFEMTADVRGAEIKKGRRAKRKR